MDNRLMRPITDSIIKQHEYYVVKKNELIQRSRNSMPPQQYKLLLYMISKIKRDDEADKDGLHYVSIQEFCKVCNMDYTSGKNYSDLKKAAIEIDKQYALLKLPDIKKEVRLRWFNRLYLNYGSGIIEYSWHEDIKPFLFHLVSNYTQYQIMYALGLQQKYSLYLYELLMSRKNEKRGFDIDLEELKLNIAASHYKKWDDFRKRALEPAIKEINEYTDIRAIYAPRPAKGKTRGTGIIHFFIKEAVEISEAEALESKEALMDRLGYNNPIFLYPDVIETEEVNKDDMGKD